jgi:hypothetical protein
MTTAQIIYEQYKVLPKRVKKELTALILQEQEEVFDDISLPAIKQAVADVKLLRAGKLQATDARDFLAELEKELEQ